MNLYRYKAQVFIVLLVSFYGSYRSTTYTFFDWLVTGERTLQQVVVKK